MVGGTGNIEADRQASHALAIDLAQKWGHQLVDKSWSERLQLIADLLEYMRDSIGDFMQFYQIVPDVVAEIIYRLSEPEVNCLEQAHLYATSRDPAHRAAAGAWFRQQSAKA